MPLAERTLSSIRTSGRAIAPAEIFRTRLSAVRCEKKSRATHSIGITALASYCAISRNTVFKVVHSIAPIGLPAALVASYGGGSGPVLLWAG